MASKGSGKFIVSLADQTKFSPKLTVRVSAVKNQDHHYKLSVHHPNKTEPVLNSLGEIIKDKRTGKIKTIGKVLHEEIVVNENPNDLEAFLAVQKIGNDLIAEGKFAHVETKYQEILFIPAGRKGRSKLKTKKAVDSGAEDEYDNLYDPNAAVDTSEVSDDIEMLDDDVAIPTEDDVDVVEDVDLEIEDEAPVIEKTKKPSAKKIKSTKNKIKNNKKSKPAPKKVKVKAKITKNKKRK